MKTSSGRCLDNRASQLWDRKAESTQCFFDSPSTQYYRRSEIALFREFFGELKGKKILKSDLWNEVNNTRILMWLAERGAHVCGFDISRYLVENTKKNFKKAGLKARIDLCDMRNLPYSGDSFDIIYSMGTIEHIDDCGKATKEFSRVLKRGGIAIIGVPNKHDPFLRPLLIRLLEVFDLYPYSPEKSFSMRELHALLEDSGFEVIARTGILFFPGPLRILDVYLYKHFRPLSLVTKLSLMPFEFLERNFSFFRRHAYLIACVAVKR